MNGRPAVCALEKVTLSDGWTAYEAGHYSAAGRRQILAMSST